MKLVDLAFLVGAALILGPLYFEIQMNRWLYYLICLIGVVLCAISGQSALAKMIGLGEPGEDLLQSWWKAIKKWFSK